MASEKLEFRCASCGYGEQSNTKTCWKTQWFCSHRCVVAAYEKELNQLIAEKFMSQVPCEHWRTWHVGFPYSRGDCSHVACYQKGFPPPYLTDVTTAWYVVKKLESMGHIVGIELAGGSVSVRLDNEPPNSVAYAEDTAYAICLLAFREAGIDVPQAPEENEKSKE